MNIFAMDLNSKGTIFTHYWEKCVGSCHAYMALREDWRAQMEKCHRELGFQYVRFHGILNDDMSVYIVRGDKPRYSFHNIDLIFDFLLKIGMKPFIELSYMPHDMASGEQTIFHYKGNVTPPKDFNEWGELIRRLTNHVVERYGIDEVRTWFFEVWNEPNLIGGFWTGTMEEYFELYRYAANAIKSVDACIPVGGPSTAINAWIPEMLDFCRREAVPIDFVSTHHYPTDQPLWSDRKTDDIVRYERGILFKMAEKARGEAGTLPLFYTEWNTSSALPDALHDESYAAAFVAKTIADNHGLVDIYSFWTFSDLFEEAALPSMPFHGGFGLQTIHGIPKPTYRVFELLHRMGNTRIPVESPAASNVEVLAVRGDHNLMLLIYNHNVPDGHITDETVSISIKGIIPKGSAVLERIDHNNANPKGKWEEMGCPEYLNSKQIEQITEASRLVKEAVPYSPEGEGIVLNLNMPPHSIAAVTLKI